MANLKSDLDQYLLLQSDQKKSFADVRMPTIKIPGIFRRSNPEPESNSWLKDTQDTCCPKLSRIQRIIMFILCMAIGVFFLVVSTFYIPVLVLKARKFALLYSMASTFFILGFGFLSGFMAMLRQMLSKERMWVSISYVGCLVATLYFSMVQQSTPLTVLFAVAQIIALFWLILGTVPGGSSGLKFFGQMFKTSVSTTLPV